MNLPNKKFALFLVLFSFSVVALFGFVLMSHENGMFTTCPFSPMGEISCSQNIFSVIHHTSSYFSFLNISLSVLVFAGWFLILTVSSFHRLFIPDLSRTYQKASPQIIQTEKKLKRWLSLFEHSPSVV